MRKNPRLAVETTITLPCTCANLRRAARTVTQFYDDILRPSGMRVTQFTLLQALTLAPRISQKELARLFEIDSTTLTRTLAHLRRKGWLSSVPGSDRRELRLSLTAAGHREYKRVFPYWDSAQKDLRRALGKTTWDQIIDASVRTAELAAKSS